MQQTFLLFFLFFIVSHTKAQTALKATGSNDTYQLITDVLAPDTNPIEVPDNDHNPPIKHIREIWDAELNTYVFAFDLHLNTDKDKGRDNDKQRNEIKTYDGSPQDLRGELSETVIYKWKFRLDENIQVANTPTTLHQLKSVRAIAAEESQPLIALVAQANSNGEELLRVRYAPYDAIAPYLKSEPLDKFRGIWVEVEETVTYAETGAYQIKIRQIDTGDLLLEYASTNLRMWKTNASYIRPKWGIYRTLPETNSGYAFRDETVLFDEFSIEEVVSDCINNVTDLNTALSNTTAGDIITLCNGEWEDLQINVNANGTVQNPIIIRAETTGLAQLTGDSKIFIGGQYIVLDGFTFKNGQPSGDGVIDFRTSSSNFCHNCTLQNTTFDAYNPIGETNVKWVRLYGTHNVVAHNSFLNKKSIGSCVLVQRSGGSNAPADFHKIHHNLFQGRRPQNDIFNDQNDQDAIRIGDSNTSMTNSNTQVYNNFFYDWEGEIEIISSKAGGNLFFNNTFDTYSGALTLRHGNNCEVFNNFFFARGGFKSGGIRVIGEEHKIYNNYIEGISNNGSNAVGAINISNGRPNSALNGYFRVKNAMIVFNTIVGGDKGIRVGTKVKSDLSEAPENIIIANNMMVDCPDAIEIITPHVGNYPYIANTRKGGSWDIPNDYANDVTANDLLTTGNITGFRRAIVGSAAENSAIGIYSFVNRDITGALRPTTDTQKDGGAEEANSDGKNRPFNQTDVANIIGTGSGLSHTCHNMNLNVKYFSVPDGTIQTSINLESNSTIMATKSVTFLAGTSVTLKSGFEVQHGGNFLAKIDDCSPQQNLKAQLPKIQDLNQAETTNRIDQIVVYPNPASHHLTIEYYLEEPSVVQLKLVSIDGGIHQVLENLDVKSTGYHQLQFNTNNLVAGMYLIQGIINKNIFSKRIVVIK